MCEFIFQNKIPYTDIYLDLTSRNIDVGQVAEEKLVRGGGYSSNGRE